MSEVIKVHVKSPDHLAIQVKDGDEQAMAIVRGWIGAPPFYDFSDLNLGSIGRWFVRDAEEGRIFQVSNKEFAEGFVRVLEVE